MYGDTAVVRAASRRMRARAEDLRTEARELVGRAEGVPWTGLAADSMRRLARDHSHLLQRSADAHEAAADALDRHAREVDRVKDLIAAAERRVLHLVESTSGGLGGLVGHVVGHVLPDAFDRWARTFDPPPHGSVAWLDVEVPGRP